MIKILILFERQNLLKMASQIYNHVVALQIIIKILMMDTPHICHNHHNRWLCKKNQSGVKFSNGYVKETALILHTMCSFTKKVYHLHKF